MENKMKSNAELQRLGFLKAQKGIPDQGMLGGDGNQAALGPSPYYVRAQRIGGAATCNQPQL